MPMTVDGYDDDGYKVKDVKMKQTKSTFLFEFYCVISK